MDESQDKIIQLVVENFYPHNVDLKDLNIINYFEAKNKINIDRNLLDVQDETPNYLDDNNIYSKSYFDDQSFENNESNDVTIHSGHRMFDLHGYTQLGAEQALRRIFTSVDRSRQQVIKINVGQGSHSQDKKGKLPDVVRKVARDLQLPQPVQHEKNKGYLLMILPPIIASE